jgi:hypothetical protein
MMVGIGRSHKPAVHIDRLPRYVLGPRGGEKDRHRGDILGLLPAAQGNHAADLVVPPFFEGEALLGGLLPRPCLPDRPVQRRLHHARAEAVDADVVGGKVLRGTLREVDQRRLRGAVRRVGLRADLPGDGRDQEDRPAAPLDHLRGEGVHHVHRADDVHLQHLRPIGGGEIPEGKAELTRADRDGVHEMVHGALFLRDPDGDLAHALDIGDVGDVPAHGHGVAASQCLRGPCYLRVAVDQGEVGPLGRKALGDRSPDPARRADDQRHRPLQV